MDGEEIGKVPEQKQDADAEKAKSEEIVPEQPKEEPKDDFSPRFKQFYGGDPKDYIKKLEDAYLNSSSEGTRLAGELKKKEQEQEIIKGLVSSDPELKTRLKDKLESGELDSDDLFDDDGKLNRGALAQTVKGVLEEMLPGMVEKTPAVQNTIQKEREANLSIYNAFKEAHPEIEEPETSQEIEETFGVLVAKSQKAEKPVDFKETLYKSYKIVTGKNPSEIQSEDTDAELEGMKKAIQKEEGSMSSPQSSSSQPVTKNGKVVLTEAQKNLAANLGLTEEDYAEGMNLSKSKEIPQV